MLKSSPTKFDVGSSTECAGVCAIQSFECSTYLFDKTSKICAIINDSHQYRMTDVQHKVAMVDVGKKKQLRTESIQWKK